MAKIKSNVELIYDARNKKSGFLQVEVESWNYEPNNLRYLANIKDYVLKEKIIDGIPTTIKELIETNQVIYSKAQIDDLFFALQNPIELTETYSNEMDSLISLALLYVTQQDPIYGNAEDWELA